MSTVLILGHTDIAQHPISIRECHINLWILPAFLGSRYLLDLGFFLKNKHATASLDSIQVLIPFAKPKAHCLVSHMEDKALDSWRIVFGTKQPPEAARMRTRIESHPIPGLRTHSCWKILLTRALPAGTEAYLRLRFASYERPTCIDTFGGWFGLGARLRLDLRLFDYREHADFLGLGENFDTRFIPIEYSYVYLVAPHVNRPELYSPDFSYIRILEGRMWRGYLSRKPSLVDPRYRKMHVFAWKRGPEDGQSIISHRIFATLIPRGFLSNAARLVSIVAGIVAIFGIAVAALYPLMTAAPAAPRAGSLPPLPSSSWITLLPRVSLIALVVLVILNVPMLVDRAAKWIRWLQVTRAKIDELVYGLRN